ncbi:MAG: DHH family phosphoesterase [Acidobacteriaceae bacterium]|nr:DHH family phosphoesterase [Acidobacteriaceae bacterium]
MRIITSYINPDLDGVSSAIAYHDLKTKMLQSETPIVIGEIDFETKVVLDDIQRPTPRSLDTFIDVESVVLVDTHHRAQLPPAFPWERVIEVIDHHPDDIEAYAKLNLG